MSSEREIDLDERTDLEARPTASGRFESPHAEGSLGYGQTIGETGFIGWQVILPEQPR